MFNRIVVTKRTRNRLTVLHESQTYGVLNERVPNPKLRQSSIEMHLQDNINMDITIDQVSIYLLLFADDAVLLSEDVQGLQQMHDSLHGYCNK